MSRIESEQKCSTVTKTPKQKVITNKSTKTVKQVISLKNGGGAKKVKQKKEKPKPKLKKIKKLSFEERIKRFKENYKYKYYMYHTGKDDAKKITGGDSIAELNIKSKKKGHPVSTGSISKILKGDNINGWKRI